MSKNSILVDFNMIIDTDLGLFKIIKERYSNGQFVNGLFFKMNDEVLIYELLMRKEINPLSIVLKKELLDNRDSLYKEFIDVEYDNILKASKGTNILDLMCVYLSTGSADVVVFCKNKSEEQLINKYNNELRTIIVDEYKDIDISQYDSIFIKDYTQCTKFSNLNAKNIFVARYKFNLDDELTPIKDISLLVGKTNMVSLIDIYNKKSYIITEG